MKTAVFLFLFTTTVCYCQIPTDSIFNLIKRESIHRNQADWTKINAEFRDRLKKSKNDTDSINAVVRVFELLNDNHSSLIYKNNSFSNYPSFEAKELDYLLPLVNLSNQNTGIFRKRILRNKILYLQIPGINASGNEIDVVAKRLSDSLCKNNFNKIKGIVLDLRLNSGGQFAAMAGGIGKLYEEGYIGGGMDAGNNPSYRFSIKDNNLFINDNEATHIKHECNTKLSDIPLAVLIGPNTRSSGTILGITLKGRKNTVFLGECTANGYSTGNNYFSFGNLILNLSTSNSVDRNNTTYKTCLNPDITITGEDNFNTPELDNKVIKAMEWLLSY